MGDHRVTQSDVWASPHLNLEPMPQQLRRVEVTAGPSTDTMVSQKLQFYFEMIVFFKVQVEAIKLWESQTNVVSKEPPSRQV